MDRPNRFGMSGPMHSHSPVQNSGFAHLEARELAREEVLERLRLFFLFFYFRIYRQMY